MPVSDNMLCILEIIYKKSCLSTSNFSSFLRSKESFDKIS